MAQAYFSLVTTSGRIKLAASAAGGDPVVITHFAVGDGNGAETNPTAASTALVREVWRTAVESVVVDPDNPSAVLVTAIIPTAAGGWWMREFGIFDEAGAMIAVARPVSQYKPTALEGQLEDIRYEFQIIIGETANVTLLVDPSLLFASREWVMTRKIPMAQMMRTPWLPVVSMTTTAPAGGPAIGDTYLVPAASSGAWAAHVGELAEWTGSAWSFLTPPNGHGISLPDGRIYERIAGVYVELLASPARAGLVKLATSLEARAGTDATKAITPATLMAALRASGVGWRGAVAFAATAPFVPADYGLTIDDLIMVPVWGAGAGASPDAGSVSNGAAGSAGGFALGMFPCPAGPTMVTIGTGGAAGLGGYPGNPGGTSSFGALVSATGGATTTAGAGVPGVGVGGAINLRGGAGGDMASDGSRVWAAGGAAPFMGSSTVSGGAGGVQSGPPGAGGACGAGIAFNGSNGLCIVIW